MFKYKDTTLSFDERAKDLLSLMTVDEKIDQMIFFDNPETLLENIENGKTPDCRCGVFGNFSEFEDKNTLTKLQDYFLNKTRLGIPLLITFESLHGLFDKNATVFPQCAGLGGSFDKELVYQMAEVIGKEGKSVGYGQLFAPNIDIPREPRWGRTQEAYSEDPYLVAEMGVEYVKGMQNNGVSATAKHYIAYGIPENGLNLSPAHIGEREVREVLLEPFIKCINAGVMSVMPSYNALDGEPLHASRKYMRDILRCELGFDGTVISDFGALSMLNGCHRVAKDAKVRA